MSSYITEIRKYVGHKTIIQCAASIICINNRGELLLGRRSDNLPIRCVVKRYIEQCS